MTAALWAAGLLFASLVVFVLDADLPAEILLGFGVTAAAKAAAELGWLPFFPRGDE